MNSPKASDGNSKHVTYFSGRGEYNMYICRDMKYASFILLSGNPSRWGWSVPKARLAHGTPLPILN